MKELIRDLRNLLNQRTYSIVVLSSLFIVIYAYFILSWSIGMDTELATYGLGNSELFISITYLVLSFRQAYLSNHNLCFRASCYSIFYFTIISMSLLFVSGIAWIVILTKKKFSIVETLTSCCFYLISPIIYILV